MASTHSPTRDLGAYPKQRTCPFSPPEVFAELRERDEFPTVDAARGPQPWLVTRYEDAKAVLGSPSFSARDGLAGFPLMSPTDIQQYEDGGESLVRMDDPKHLEKRRRLTRDFTVKRIATLRDDIERVINGVLDNLLARDGSAELVSTVALPIPSQVICLILGVPYAEHAFFQRKATEALAGDSDPETVRTALGELGTFLAGLIDVKRKTPDDGVLSRLVHDFLIPGEIDEQEVVTMAMTLLIAGFETTSNMISLGTALFLTHPEQRDAFVSGDETLRSNAVEELLRYLTIAQHPRQAVATEDTEIGGNPVQAGEGVVISLPSANRDETAFNEPDTFDITRTARHHLAFSYGTHQCLGQSLARQELLLYFGALFHRIPNLRLLDEVENFDLKQQSRAHGFRSLHIAW